MGLMRKNLFLRSSLDDGELPEDLYTQWFYSSGLGVFGERQQMRMGVNKINPDLIVLKDVKQSLWQRLISVFMYFPRCSEQNFVYKKEDLNEHNILQLLKQHLPSIKVKDPHEVIFKILEKLDIPINRMGGTGYIAPLFSGSEDDLWGMVIMYTLDQKKFVDLHPEIL